MSVFAFVVVALIAVASALGMVLRRNPIHGALFLVINLFCVAVFYLMLGAEFLAAAQVIVYAGAIMVLFLFAIFVLIPGKEETGPDPRRPTRILAAPVGAVLFVLLIVMLSTRGGQAAGGSAADGSVASLGRLLFTDYLFPFELTSVLLLAAMVGVLVLARKGPS